MQSPYYASAHSVHADSGAALEQGLERLEQQLGGRRPDLLLAFSTPHHLGRIDSLGRIAERRLGAGLVAGATGGMLIAGELEIEEGPGLVLWAACLPDARLRLCHLTVEENPEGGWNFLGFPDLDRPAECHLMLIADPFTFPVGDCLSWIDEEHAGLVVFGGVASGGSTVGTNRFVFDDRTESHGALGLFFEDGARMQALVSQGCRPIGEPYVITASQGNRIKKLRGKGAASELLRTIDALPVEERELFRRGAFIGLAVDATKSQFETGDLIVRQIAGLQPKEGAIVVHDDSLRPGMSVQFLVRDEVSASSDLARTLESVASDYAVPSIPSHDRGALVFTCTGRGKRMFHRAHHDAATVQETLGPGLPLAGFFANGEIGPVGSRNFLHGFSASLALFR